MKIGIIGHFGGNKKFNDGQTVKTLEVNKYIENYFKINTEKLDTYYNSKNIFSILIRTIRIMKNNDKIILIVSKRGYKVFATIIFFLNMFYKRKLYDLVIGGNRYNLYDKNQLLKKFAKSFTKIYVETNAMKKEYNNRNIYNVDILPNFKNISLAKPDTYKLKEKIKICSFTRVNVYKGIEDAINAVTLANEKYGENIFFLDIYGCVDKDYKDRFNEVLKSLPSFVKYKGEVPYDKSIHTIKKYDLMLFLTFWKGEGFPGTLIDTIFAGVPVIATNWNCNFEILKENENSLKVEVNDINTVANNLLMLYNNQKKLFYMRKHCLDSAILYTPDQAMKKFIKELSKN